MPKHFFSQTSFQAPYSTVSIAALRVALVDKRLGGKRPRQLPKKVREPFHNQMVWVRPPRDKMVLGAEAWCNDQMLTDLKAGALVAYAQNEQTENFFRIPISYWGEDFAAEALHGLLKDKQLSSAIPTSIRDAPVCVLNTDAVAWLKNHAVTELDINFPSELRNQFSHKNATRRTRYEWNSFDTEAIKRLMYIGGFDAEWIQADLEREMLAWCGSNWGKEPSLRMVRERVKLAANRFFAEKQTIS